MSEESVRRDINRIKGQIATIEKNQATARQRMNKKRSDAANIRSSIKSTTSKSTYDSKIRSSGRIDKEADREEARLASHSKDIQRKEANLDSAYSRLVAAEKTSERKKGQETKRKRTEEKRHLAESKREQERTDRQDRVRRQTEIAHERALTREVESRGTLYSDAVNLDRLRNLPENISVLFVLADPLDQRWLDLGNEVRDVSQRIERAKHRDAVKLEQVTATQPKDLIPALNKFEPRIVHFSGHGSETDGLIFRDEAGDTKLVAPDALAATIATVSDNVGLVVLNACDSGEHAELLVEHVDAAIGMADEVGDNTARIFSAALYGSIADGSSIRRAFDQACAAVRLECPEEPAVPRLYVKDGLNADELVLVRPPDDFLDLG